MSGLLLWAPHWVGDWVMATPAFAAARAARPGGRIGLVTLGHLAPLADGSGWFDEVIAYDRHARGADGPTGLLRRIRAAAFDEAILFPYSFRSAWMAWRAGIRRRIGYATQGRSLLLTDPIPAPREGRRVAPRYMGEVYRDLATVAGIEAPVSPLHLCATDAERARADALLARHGASPGERFVAVSPGASFGPSKRWPAAHFADAGRALARALGLRCLVLAAPGEESIEAEVARSLGDDGLSIAPDILPLGALKGVMPRVHLHVTNDTGGRHVSAALGVPTVVLVGPMDPRYTDHPHPGVRVLRHEVPCAPCNLPACPIDHRCLRWIAPREVVEAGRGLVTA